MIDGLAALWPRVGSVEISVAHPRSGAEPLVVTDPAELGRLAQLLAVRREADAFACMCWGERAFELLDADRRHLALLRQHEPDGLDWAGWGGQLRLADGPGLLAYLEELGNAQVLRWIDLAPAPLRPLARTCADRDTQLGADITDPSPNRQELTIAIEALRALGKAGPVLLAWYDQSVPRAEEGVLPHRLLPALLLGELTGEEWWPVIATGRQIDPLVRYFSGPTFAARHPRKRRLPLALRQRLLRYARSARPEQLRAIERRVLTAP